MAETGEENTNGNQEIVKKPRSLEISAAGTATGAQFANLMSAVMADVIDGSLSTDVSNAVCNAGGKLLKVVEMQYKYGGQQKHQGPPDLSLTGDAPD